MSLSPLKFRKTAPGGAASEDGLYEVSSIDRFSYSLRMEDKAVVVPCEHFERNGQPAVAFNLKGMIEFQSNAIEAAKAREILSAALLVIGRAVEFD